MVNYILNMCLICGVSYASEKDAHMEECLRKEYPVYKTLSKHLKIAESLCLRRYEHLFCKYQDKKGFIKITNDGKCKGEILFKEVIFPELMKTTGREKDEILEMYRD